MTEGPIMVQCPSGPRTNGVLMLKADDWSFLRRLHVQEGKSIRWISKEFDISRKTVARYVKEPAVPKYSLASPRPSPVLEPFKKVIDDILLRDQTAPPKHRHTAKRIYDRLVVEQGFTGSETTVRRYVARVREQGSLPAIFVPLIFSPGRRAQVDFGDVFVCVNCPFAHLPLKLRAESCTRVPTKLQCFVMRLCASRRLFAMCFPSANTVSFIAAHKHAFGFFGSRPKELVYDNLVLAVRKVLRGRERELSKSFLELAGYYGFGYHFCKPGKEGAHEKGGVESGIGYVRANWFVPVLHVQSIDELNDYLLSKCTEDMNRTVDGQTIPIKQAWEIEVEHMIQLPAAGIDACVVEPAAFDSYGMVRYGGCFYSIPDTVTTRNLWVKAYWDRIEITDGSKVVARHVRSYEHKKRVFEPEHYFNILEQRPGAVGFAQPLRAAAWPAGYWEFFEELQERMGPSEAGREFIQLLRLHGKFGSDQMEAAVAKARTLETYSVDAVKSILIADMRPSASCLPLDLTEREHLLDYDVLITDLTQYQDLAGGAEHAEYVA